MIYNKGKYMTIENFAYLIGGILAGNVIAIGLACVMGKMNACKERRERRIFWSKPEDPIRWD